MVGPAARPFHDQAKKARSKATKARLLGVVDNSDFGESESNIIQTASVNERQLSESRHHLR
jgi:hypothetical protein